MEIRTQKASLFPRLSSTEQLPLLQQSATSSNNLLQLLLHAFRKNIFSTPPPTTSVTTVARLSHVHPPTFSECKSSSNLSLHMHTFLHCQHPPHTHPLKHCQYAPNTLYICTIIQYFIFYLPLQHPRMQWQGGNILQPCAVKGF